VKSGALGVATAVTLLALGCGGTKIIGADLPAANCDVTPSPPPTSLGLDPFYEKYLDATGIPIVGSSAPADASLVQACSITVRMLAARADVRSAMMAANLRVAVIAVGEVTTDLPEYRNFYTLFPGTDWNGERGVGATTAIPVSSAGEENLLCLPGDRFEGESILVQNFASAVRIGIDAVDAGFESMLATAFSNATTTGLWVDTFAAGDAGSYFAYGTQAWFDAAAEASPPNGKFGPVGTRQRLQAYDPALAALASAYYPADDWREVCP
jgi:hypothetical protein